MDFLSNPVNKWKHALPRADAKYYDFEDLTPFEDLVGDYLIDRYGCVHAFFRLESPAADVATAAQLIQIQNQLTQIIEKTPDHIVQTQFIYTTNGDYTEVLVKHPTYKSEWGMAQYLRQIRSERLLQSVRDRKLVRASTLMVLTCVPYAEGAEQNNAVMDQLKLKKDAEDTKLPQRILREVEFEQSVNTMRTARNVVEDCFSKVGIKLEMMHNIEIVEYFYRLYNPDMAIDMGIPVNFDPDFTPFADAWLCGDMELLDNCYRWGEYYHGFVSMSAKPQESTPRLIERISTELPFNDFRVTFSVRRLDKIKEIDKLKDKRTVSIGKRRSGSTIWDMLSKDNSGAASALRAEENIEAKEEIDEANHLIAELRGGREFLCQCQLVIHFWHRDRQEMARRREILVARMSDMNKARGWAEVASTEAVMVNNLPGAYEPFVRPMKIKSHMAADMMPINRGFEGGDEPISIFRNSAGGLVTLDLFSKKAADAPMAFVSGATGSGKSFLVNQLLMQHMVGSPIVMILDLGGSYESLVDQLGGQMIRFDPEKPTCFNPLQVFSKAGEMSEPDEATRARILVNLEAMVTQNSDPNGELPNNLRNLIDTAVVQAFAHAVTRRDPVVTLSHLVERLNNFGEDGFILVERLKPFLQGEVFGHWFDGPSEVDLRTSVICFDLKGVKKMPVLTKALIPMVINFCYERVLASKGQKKILIFEEMWDFITNPRIVDFIVESYKTFRKENAAVVGVSQSLADIASNPKIASALVQNVQTWFLMEQGNPDNIKLAAEMLNLSDGQVDILNNLQRKAVMDLSGNVEMYRESLMIRGKGKGMNSGKIRVQPMPEEYWLSTTAPEEFSERERALKQFEGDLTKAIAFLAKKYPGGMFIKKMDM
jgi:hypothetical protein